MKKTTAEKLPLRSIEDAVLVARLIINPEEMRKIIAILDESKRVSRKTLMFEFTI